MADSRPLLMTVLVGALLSTGNLGAQMEQPGLRGLEREEREQHDHSDQPALTRQPRITYHQSPVYPEAAQREGRQGDVLLRITIDEEGYVRRADVLMSAGADLDWAAMGAVTNFVFLPAEVDGVPAAIQLDYVQKFVLSQVVKEVLVAPKPLSSTESATTPPGNEKPPVPVEAQPINFRGMVRESGTKHPLEGAEVSVQIEGKEIMVVATDKTGRFEMRGVPDGKGLVRASLTGYEAMSTVEEFTRSELVEAIYYIPRRSYNKFETVVRDRWSTKEVNRVQLQREEVSQVAGTFGDPLRVIENMPGMARAPLLGGQLLVRGTSPQDTGVYMDGVQIPLLYHFGGLTSVINADFLETIDFHPGGFDAFYGRATGGIVDVKTRQLQLDEYRGGAKIDLFETGFFFGGPVTLWGDKVESQAPNPRRLTFAFAARRSYIDALIPLALEVLLPGGTGAITVAPVYWDYQTKLEYRPFASHAFQLFGFGSDDSLKVLPGGTASDTNLSLGTHTQFHRGVAQWVWRISPRMQNRAQAFVGMDASNLGFKDGLLGLNSDTITRVFGMRNELHYSLLDEISFNLGMDYTVSSTALETNITQINGPGGAGLGRGGGAVAMAALIAQYPRVFPLNPGVADLESTTTYNEDGVQLNLAPYVEAEIGPIAGMKFVPGFRFDYFKYGTRTRVFDPAPRLAIRWEPIKGSVLKAAYGVYEQMPHPSQVSGQTGNPDLRPERSRHVILGAEQRITSSVNVAINGFYSQRRELVASSNRILENTNGAVNRERYSNSGIGRVCGVDILLRHNLSNSFYGWVAYTLSRSEMKLKPHQKWTLFTFDQTHILTLIAQYKIPWHLPFREWSRTGRLPHGLWWNTGWAILSGDWSVGGRFRWVTGNPTTFYNGSFNDLDRDEFVGKSLGTNENRMPPYHQLDVRVDYKMAFDNWLVDLYVDLINVYNRQNPEIIQWDYRYQNYNAVGILPFLPIVGATVEF